MKRVELNVDYIGGEGEMTLDEKIALSAYIKKRKAKLQKIIATSKSNLKLNTQTI